MKKRIILSVVLLVVVSLAISIFVLWKAGKPANDIQKDAEQLALSSKHLAVASDTYTYNGNAAYVTVFGKDEYGKEKIVFVPDTLEEQFIQEVYAEDGLSKSEALSVVASEVEMKEVLHAKLGYEEVGAVWEIAYLNKSDKLNYVYILYKDGTWWKRILNL
jgi:uncharacterized protein YpmB